MKRRKFLALLSLAPAAPLVAKELLKEATPAPAAVTEIASAALPPGCVYGSYSDPDLSRFRVPGDYYDGRFGSEPVWVTWHAKFGPPGTAPVTTVYVKPVRS